MSQFRQNPISKHWVLIAPNRSKRPEEFGTTAATDLDLPEIDKTCAFCPGNESLNLEIDRFPHSPKNSTDWLIRIIPNKYEILAHVPVSKHAEFYVNRSGSGDNEVVITRKHNEPVALQSVQTIEQTMHVFKNRILDLSLREHLAYVQIFHNHGRDAGASLIHPHHQIIATPIIPPGIHDEISGCYYHRQNTGNCIYCEIIDEERTQRERVLFETDLFIVFAPYASRTPFEMWILPKRHSSNFEESTDEELAGLAQVLKTTSEKLYVKLNDPPLNFYLHTMPFEHPTKHTVYDKKAYHWHITVFTRLTIWAGFEYSTGIPINPLSPEDAVAFLK